MTLYKNHPIVKGLIVGILALCPLLSFANDLGEYQLKSVYSTFYYYNFCQKGEELFIGSDHGILKFINLDQISIKEGSQKGYVYLEDKKLVTYPTYTSGTATPEFSKLLPQEFQNKAVTGTAFKSYMLVISKGQLFIYKKALKTFNDSLSIRSITKNFLGTYNGIFYKGLKTPFKYTSGYIREFDNETIICYDGLYRLQANKTTYYDNLSGEKFSRLNLGFARDIYKVNDQKYLIFTTTGLFISNLKDYAKTVLPVKKGPEPRFITTMDRGGIPIFLFFNQNNKVYEYTLATGKLRTLLTLDNDLGEIEDSYFDPYDMGKIFIVTKEKLLQANASIENKYTIEILAEGLESNHHILRVNEDLLIPSNSGLSAYNLTTKTLTKNIIKDEFNKRAIYTANDTVYLGTIHGYYKLNTDEIATLTSIATDEKETTIEDAANYNYVDYLLGLACLSLIGLCFYFYTKSKQTPISITAISESEINQFIEENIATVTIQHICEKFKINGLQLNEILKSDKPGQIIRKKRMEIVNQMRKQKKDVEEINKASGFSISYLKKIKS